MKISAAVVFLLLAIVPGGACHAQETDAIETMQQKIDDLETALAEARSEIEALNKKIADLSKGGGKLSTKGPTLSERLKEGVELQGDYRSALVSGMGRINMVVHKRDGSKITGTSTLSVEGKDLGETRWEGVVKGTRLTMTRVGSGNKVNTTLDLKGDSLEGSFVDSQGNRGTIGLRFPIP